MKRICWDIWYRIKRPAFLMTVLFGCIAFGTGILTDLIPTWRWGDSDLIYMYEAGIYTGIFHIAAPLIAILPNVSRLSSFTGDTRKYELTRCRKSRWLLSEMTVSGIIGGSALMFGPLLVIGILSLRYPMASHWLEDICSLDPQVNESFSNLLIAERYGTYLTAKLALVFLYGVSVNMLASMIASCTRDSFVIAFLPLMAIQTLINWTEPMGNIYLKPHIYLSGKIGFLPMDNTAGFFSVLFLIQMSVWAVCFAISYIIMERRRRYE